MKMHLNEKTSATVFFRVEILFLCGASDSQDFIFSVASYRFFSASDASLLSILTNDDDSYHIHTMLALFRLYI